MLQSNALTKNFTEVGFKENRFYDLKSVDFISAFADELYYFNLIQLNSAGPKQQLSLQINSFLFACSFSCLFGILFVVLNQFQIEIKQYYIIRYTMRY